MYNFVPGMLLWTFNSISTLAFFYISKGLVRYLECPLPHSLSVDHTIEHRIGGMWLFGTTLDCFILCPVASTTRQLNSSTMDLGKRCCQEFISKKCFIVLLLILDVWPSLLLLSNLMPTTPARRQWWSGTDKFIQIYDAVSTLYHLSKQLVGFSFIHGPQWCL